MKILFLSRHQQVLERGAETVVRELAKEFDKQYEVKIFSGRKSDDLIKIIQEKADIVIAMNGRMQALKASIGRLFGGYKLVITGQSGIGRDDIWNIVVARPNVFVALTSVMEKWAKLWGKGLKIAIIPNGVDASRFEPHGQKLDFKLKKPIVLSVGALTSTKHHERTIEAIAKLDGISLLIVGKGEKKEELELLAKQKIPNRFKITSFSYEDLPAVYRSCDLFVLPSWDREAFGIVYVEALASGLGVVAPDDEVRREIIGEAGILVDVTNPDQYAAAMKKALEIDWLNKSLKRASKFSWKEVAQKYLELFEAIK